MKRVLVSGPYGGYNLGDEFILSEISRQVREAGFEAWATSADPAYTRRCHGLDSVPLYAPRRLRLGALGRLREFDALVIGGGEQFSEPRVPNPVWGLLAQAATLSRAARMLGRPTMAWSVGVDAGITPVGRAVARWGFRNAAALTVRDHASAARLREMGFPPEQVVLAADPVFATPAEDRARARAAVRAMLGVEGDGPVVLLAPSNDQLHSMAYLGPLLEGARRAAEAAGATVAGLLMDRRAEGDQALLSRPEVRAAGWLRWLPVEAFDAALLRRIYAGVDVVASTRMHPLIIASTQATPWLGIARSAKMRALFEALGGVEGMEVEDVAADEVAARLSSLLGAGGAAHLARIAPGVREHALRAGRAREVFARWAGAWRGEAAPRAGATHGNGHGRS